MSQETVEEQRAKIESVMRERFPLAAITLEQSHEKAAWIVSVSTGGAEPVSVYRSADAIDALGRAAHRYGVYEILRLRSELSASVACGVDEILRLRSELSAARAALRDLAPRCKTHDEIASRTAGTWRSPQRVCDRSGCESGQPILCESEHAEAIRAAKRAR